MVEDLKKEAYCPCAASLLSYLHAIVSEMTNSLRDAVLLQLMWLKPKSPGIGSVWKKGQNFLNRNEKRSIIIDSSLIYRFPSSSINLTQLTHTANKYICKAFLGICCWIMQICIFPEILNQSRRTGDLHKAHV